MNFDFLQDFSLKKLWNATLNSINGLRDVFRNERAFRLEAYLAFVLIPLALFLPLSSIAKTLLICSVFLVLIVELLNSGIETIVDLVTDKHNNLAGRAKDIGSSAVMLSFLNLIVTWILIIKELF
jgi:diacylglycerol kinase (ATP)